MANSLDAARQAYDAIPLEAKQEAGVDHPQHTGLRVLPVLEFTTLREIHDAVPEGEVVVLATVIGSDVEFGMFQGVSDQDLAGEEGSLEMTMRQLIDMAMEQGQPGPQPGDPLHNPNA